MVSDQELIAAYQEMGSVWRAGEQLGLSGQKVHARLTKLGAINRIRVITEDEIRQIREYYETTPPAEFDLSILSKQLGRTRHLICRTARTLGLTKPNRPDSAATISKNSARQKQWYAEHEHPRGALGIVHSAETRSAISLKSKQTWATMKAFNIGKMLPENRDKQSRRMALLASLRSPEKVHTRARGGRRADIGDIWFRSSWEANYARYLNLLVKLGAVESWEYEPETFWFEGVPRGTTSYKPDFRIKYKGDDRIEYIELKGWVTAKDRVKWQRMAKYHPHIKLVIIKEKQYHALRRKWASAIPEWESSRGGGQKLGVRQA